MTLRNSTTLALLATFVAFLGLGQDVQAEHNTDFTITSPNNANAGGAGPIYIPSSGGTVGVGGSVEGLSLCRAPQLVVNIYDYNANYPLGFNPSSKSYSNALDNKLQIQNAPQPWSVNMNTPNYGSGYQYVIFVQLQDVDAQGNVSNLYQLAIIVTSN